MPRKAGAVQRHWHALALAALFALPASAFAVQMDADQRALSRDGFAATGSVSCGTGSGTAQLVGSQSVIVTASHVLFGHGGARASSCTFSVMVDGQLRAFEIDMTRVRSGSQRPYADHASFDWAVARLKQPVQTARPYPIGGPPSAGMDVRLVSGRTLPWSRAATVESCAVRGLRRAPGGAEAMLDCSAQSGDSGAAILTADGRIIGVYVGFRSAAPNSRQPYSDTHYNFAVGLTGRLRAAVAELAR